MVPQRRILKCQEQKIGIVYLSREGEGWRATIGKSNAIVVNRTAPASEFPRFSSPLFVVGTRTVHSMERPCFHPCAVFPPATRMGTFPIVLFSTRLCWTRSSPHSQDVNHIGNASARYEGHPSVQFGDCRVRCRVLCFAVNHNFSFHQRCFCDRSVLVFV